MPGRDVVLAVLAVDATTVDDWTRSSSPLRERLRRLLGELAAAGLAPDLVLWQQGEADARSGTPLDTYVSAFELLLRVLGDAGSQAPVLVARSTRCGDTDGIAVRQALQQLAARHPAVRPGPDTDTLQGNLRAGPCHFSRAGLDAAAALWARAIATEAGAR
jgi:hypothetical protein